MKGFTDGIPFSVAVTWLPKNADGSPREVPLLNAEPFPYGLLAETQNAAGVTTRWFVPWQSVVYIKQDQPAPVVAQVPVTPVAPAAQPADPAVHT